MKANIPPEDNHVNVKTGARRTWKYGERKVVRIERNADDLIIGIEEATNEAFGFLGNGHDVARVEYGRYYIIEFREGGPLKGYWSIACEQLTPRLNGTASYKGEDYAIDLVTAEKSAFTVTLSKKTDQKVIIHRPWSHCVPVVELEDLQNRAAVSILNRRLKPEFLAMYSDVLGAKCIEIKNRKASESSIPLLRIWLTEPGRRVFLMVEYVLREYGLPVGAPDIER